MVNGRWLKRNRDAYLLETSAPGIFAAGDVRQGAVRRVASAVGEGTIAVSLVHQYLRTIVEYNGSFQPASIPRFLQQDRSFCRSAGKRPGFNLRNGPEITLAPGEALFAEGSQGDQAYIIKSARSRSLSGSMTAPSCSPYTAPAV